MTDPVTAMAAISMGMTVAGGGVKAMGSVLSGRATEESLKYKAAVAEQNRQYQLMAGDVAQERVGMKERFQESQTKAIQGASNLDVDRGSAPLVRQSEHDIGIQEQGIERSKYARAAYGEEVEAQLDIQGAKMAKKAIPFDVASSLLGAGSSVSDKWLNLYGKPGSSSTAIG